MSRRTQLDPAAEAYVPPEQPLSQDCEAAKDLLMFFRNAGIRCDALEVGSVRIHNLTDDYPRKQPREPKRGDPEFDD